MEKSSNKNNQQKRFILTFIVLGAAAVVAIIIGLTLWMSAGARSATDKAVDQVSRFYMRELADRRSQAVSGMINQRLAEMRRALQLITPEDLTSQETLRAAIGRVEALYGLDLYALADEDNVVYTDLSTYMGGSRYAFLSQDPMDDPVISTVSLYGVKKQVCLAIPVRDLRFMGKDLKACFVEIDVGDFVNTLAFDAEESESFFCLYYRNGENLTQLDFGSIRANENLLRVMQEKLPEAEWRQLEENFQQGLAGSAEFSSSGSRELLYYAPIPDTSWMITVMIPESLIHDQIRGFSDETLTRSTVQITVTCIVLLLYFGTVILMLRKATGAVLEEERQNARDFSRKAEESEAELGVIREIATRDALTSTGSKFAYTEKEKALNEAIRNGELRQLAVVVCDLNGLKLINDTYGHARGDEYIREASRLICGLYKHSPVFRVGGDEFVVLLQNDDFEQREAILEELNRRVEENLRTGRAVVSAGMADYEPGDQQVDAVLRRADQRMYERKKQLKEMGAAIRE